MFVVRAIVMRGIFFEKRLKNCRLSMVKNQLQCYNKNSDKGE